MSAKESSYIKLPNGSEVIVYPIHKFAEAIGRSQLTIRRWERAGIIPRTFFYNNRGFRMYSQEQIDIVVNALEEVGYTCKAAGLLNTEFSSICHSKWNELKNKYMEVNHEEANNQ